MLGFNTPMDDRLLDATMAVLAEQGWDGVTLDRVAEAAGSSRVTLWRQGVTKDTLIEGLLGRLVDDYVELMWPVLASPKPAPQRLEGVLNALFEVADRHLSLLAVSDQVFHWAADLAVRETRQLGSFLDPFVSVLRAGLAEGSLGARGNLTEAADVLFNTACWGYVHLRLRHGWPKARARRQIAALLVSGTLAAEEASAIRRDRPGP